MSEYLHPLWPDTPESRSAGLARRIDELWKRSHGPWRNAGAGGQPSLDPGSVGITAAAGYINGVGVRWRSQLGGGTLIEIAVDGGSAGDVVILLPAGNFLPGEGKIALPGHDSTGAYRAFYIDTSTGGIVIGV